MNPLRLTVTATARATPTTVSALRMGRRRRFLTAREMNRIAWLSLQILDLPAWLSELDRLAFDLVRVAALAEPALHDRLPAPALWERRRRPAHLDAALLAARVPHVEPAACEGALPGDVALNGDVAVQVIAGPLQQILDA